VHYIPSRIAVVLWLGAALFLPASNAAQAADQLRPSLERARPQKLALLSAASVLKLGLGGPASAYVPEAWVGTGTVKPGAADLQRALYAFILLHLFLFVLLGLFL
jgi:cobalamin biosynthesis protein CobD/CbiB